jgi:hypothetical protein
MSVINMIIVTNGNYNYDHGYVYGTYDRDNGFYNHVIMPIHIC